jgi:hypothetical protein
VSRLRTFAAFTALAAFMCLGIGTATAAGNSSSASESSNSSIVSNEGAGSLTGWVRGNAHAAQQTAAGGGASNANNSVGVSGNSGTLVSGQGTSDWTAVDPGH